MISIINELHSQ